MNNVVIFPGGKKNSPTSVEEILERVETNRLETINYLTEEITNSIVGVAYEEGFDLTKDESIKMLMFLEETIRSALQKTVNLEHPFHEMVEDLLTFEDEPEETPE